MVENQDAATREQCAGHFKRRVFGGGADERDGAVFDRVQERVLLRFVEAMDLVDEEDGTFAVTLFSLRLLNRLAQVFHAEKTADKAMKRSRCFSASSRASVVFTRAGRAPEDQRR